MKRGYFNLPVIFLLAFIVAAVVIGGGFFTGFFAGPFDGPAFITVTDSFTNPPLNGSFYTFTNTTAAGVSYVTAQNFAEFISGISEQSFIWGWIILGMAVCVGVVMFFVRGGAKPKKQKFGKKK